MQGDELVGLPNEICLGFVRIATNRRLGTAAVGIREAREVVENWIHLPKPGSWFRLRITSPASWNSLREP